MRRLPFAGATNFRDLGGYPTASGGHTRWSLVFRSDSLHYLTAEDLITFDALGVKTIYDLRREEERQTNRGPRDCIGLSLSSRRVEDADPLALKVREDGESWLRDVYLVMLEQSGPVFGRLFTGLADPSRLPAVFHCAGGKDRTGMSAALLLSALGVEREVILDDFDLSNEFGFGGGVPAVRDVFVGWGMTESAAEGILSAPRWAMAEALDQLEAVYGGIEEYLIGPGGMAGGTLKSLRAGLVA